ncbi:MAG TPA: glycosyltransferase family 39 protein [Bradyrhizobium sp.]|uniref:glycosyltransferase family 39 protein n=1 Tax=Bradyrhizobium sp. TaxID=376 RepID=UPI002D80F1FD|nr:glycosyltransferase family 39 protein [Bradyrhizobium sp.]HET7884627.1 glycosyltransferase family 39 protein [Bradyrhizobium sp.]
MTLMRGVYAGLLDLRTDEAYYWTWSKENVLSFLDHPPMVAWLVRIGTAIFGDTNFGARFAGLVAMLATEALLADLVWRATRDLRAVAIAVLMMEASLYFGLLMTKISPDVPQVLFVTAMVWALVRLAVSGEARWWLAAGVFAGLAALSKFTIALMIPAVLAFALVPRWRSRWLRSPYPYIAALLALLVFMPVVIWNMQHDWASFRFQAVRATSATVEHAWSLRTFGEFVGLQFGLVGFVLLPVVLTGVVLTAWRAVRRRDEIAILLSTAVIVPFVYFLWKSLSLRIGDTWPTLIWPLGFAAAAINLSMLSKEGWSASFVAMSFRWANIAIASGVAFVIAVCIYYLALPYNFIGRTDPVGGEAGYEAVVAGVETELQKTGASWIATTDYRTCAMLRWFFRDRIPVVQLNERGRYQGFAAPDLSRIAGHAGLYVAREPENNPSIALWASIPARREPLTRVDRVWRGIVMDSYAIERFTGWTPELSPPRDSPLFGWRWLA